MERDFEEENNLVGGMLMKKLRKRFKKKHPKMARKFGRRFKKLAPIVGIPPAVIRVNTYDPVTGENHFKLFKKIGAGIKKVTKKIGGALKAATLLPALLPLLPVMKKALKKKKINPGNNPMKIAQAFYDAFIAKKGKSFEEIQESYTGSDSVAFVAAIIPPIIKLVKGIISKKKKGEPIPPEFEEAAAEAVKIEAKLEAAANKEPGGATAVIQEVAIEDKGGPKVTDEKPVLDKAGSFLSSPWLLAGVGALVLIILLMMFRRQQNA